MSLEKSSGSRFHNLDYQYTLKVPPNSFVWFGSFCTEYLLTVLHI